jgi:hypothetical protein
VVHGPVDLTQVVCEMCRQRADEPRHVGDSAGRDCASAFRAVDSYFHASVWTCPSCGRTWLAGYHEDFSDTPIEDEWGKRIRIYRLLTPALVAQINAAIGSRSLDIDSFGKSKPA